MPDPIQRTNGAGPAQPVELDAGGQTARGTRRTAIIGVMLAALWTLGLTGCASYQLRGRVIEGKVSQVLVVDRHDARLTQRGLGATAITVTQDPESLGRKVVGTGQSDGQGTFSIPISSFGAGFLEYQMEVVARRQGRVPAQRIMQLPSSDQRILIVLQPGQDRPPSDNDNLLQNTLKMSQPYMNE